MQPPHHPARPQPQPPVRLPALLPLVLLLLLLLLLPLLLLHLLLLLLLLPLLLLSLLLLLLHLLLLLLLRDFPCCTSDVADLNHVLRSRCGRNLFNRFAIAHAVKHLWRLKQVHCRQGCFWSTHDHQHKITRPVTMRWDETAIGRDEDGRRTTMRPADVIDSSDSTLQMLRQYVTSSRANMYVEPSSHGDPNRREP